MSDFIKTVSDILKKVTDENAQEARFLVEKISKKTLAEILRGDEIKNKDEILSLAKKRVKEKLPIQYVAGIAEFMGVDFRVNESVLIPRVETELLVLEAIKIIENKKEPVEILDIGIGSGCISCMIAKLLPNTNLQILGVDISSKALAVAIENIEKHVTANRVIVRKSDIFSNIGEKFDVIISNPPYIPINKKDTLQKELSFEPEEALFADDNGFYFYRKIIEEGKNFLNPEGFILFEAGIGQADDIREIFETNGFSNIRACLDMQNIKRVVSAQKI